MFQYALVFFVVGNMCSFASYGIFRLTLPDAHIYLGIFFLFTLAVMFVTAFVDMVYDIIRTVYKNSR